MTRKIAMRVTFATSSSTAWMLILAVVPIPRPSHYTVALLSSPEWPNQPLCHGVHPNHAVVKEVSNALECGAVDVAKCLCQLQAGKKDAFNQEKIFKAEATRALVQDLASTVRDLNGAQILFLHRE